MSARPRSAASFGPIALIDFTRLFAKEVGEGKYPYVEYDADRRWHQRIYRDARLDVWLISWLPTQATSLHDHGGSAGAFTVIEGELTETIAAQQRGRSRRPVEYTRQAGESVGFGSHYIHDVRNAGVHAALSVHAYSPPLTSMTYYDLEDTGWLSPIATVRTGDPEHELSAEDLRSAS
jgi:hypothetical protein